MANNLKLTSQLFVTEMVDGFKGVYSPFSHGVAFLDSNIWDNLTCGRLAEVPADVVEYLEKNNILVADGFEEAWRAQSVDEDVRLYSMFLVSTQDCNFTCAYCAVIQNFDSAERRNEKMSLETGRQAVHLFARQLQLSQPPQARVTFYGGEPMLNRELIQDLVPRIKAIAYPGQKTPVEVVVITNGYIFDAKLAAFLKSHGAGICISLDGTRRHQDVTRRAGKPTGKRNVSTFDRVIANYTKYRELGLTLGISVALGRHNVYDLDEIAAFFADELVPPFVEFQVPYQVAAESNAFWVSTREVSPFILRGYEVLAERGIIEAFTYRRVKDFMAGRVRIRDCSASAGQLVVAPDGSVGPCHSLVGTRKFFTGSVADPDCDPRTMENFIEWARRYPLKMQVCHDCPFIGLCGGGCLYNSYITTGTIWDKDPQVCAYMEALITWILRNLWRGSGMAERYGQTTVAG